MFHYNSEKRKLYYTEYGRIVQDIADHLCTLDNAAERNKMAKSLIEVMAMLNPQSKHLEGYREKLWNHLFHMTDYRLDVECPYEIVKVEDKPIQKAEVLHYPGRGPKIRHYGKYVEQMVRQALVTEDEEKKEAYQDIIGNFMKMAYKNWNNETVTDEQIVIDLKLMSDGKIDVSNSELDILHRSHSAQRKLMQKTHGNGSNNNNNNGQNKNKNKNKNKKYKFNNNNGGNGRNRGFQ